MVPSVNRDGFTTDRGAHKLTVLHRYRKCDQARPPHFIALLDDDIVLALAGRRKAKEGAGEGGSGRSGRRVLVEKHRPPACAGARAAQQKRRA